MKRWSECRTPKDKIEAIREAFATVGDAVTAARVLGMNRQYLYEVMHELGLRRVGSVVSVGASAVPDTKAVPVVSGTVGVSERKQLTYAGSAPTLRIVSTQAPMVEDVTRVAFDLPKSIKDWLEREALRRKQEGSASRMAISPIIVELVREKMAQEPKP